MLRRLFIAPVLLCLTLVSTINAESVVDLNFNNVSVGIVLLYDNKGQFVIDSNDIPTNVFDEGALDTIQRVTVDGCSLCLQLADLGSVEYDILSSRVDVMVFPRLAAARVLNFDKRNKSNLPAGRGFSLQVPLNLSYSLINDKGDRPIDPFSDIQRKASFVIARPSISLGALGVLRGGVRYTEVRDDDERNENSSRLPIFLENHFPSFQSSLLLGETITDSDLNDGSLPITGFRLYRNFATRPDLTDLPSYDYFTLVERPSIVEIYQNSELIRREQVDNPGPVVIEDLSPSEDGRVRIFVTDANGTQRVLEADLLVNRDNLGKGQLDYGIAYGNRRILEETDSNSTAGSIRFNYGVTNTLTLGVLAEGSFTDPDSRLFDAPEEVYNTGLVSLWSTGFGVFDGTYKVANDSEGRDGFSATLGWRYSTSVLGKYGVSVKAALFEEEDYFSASGNSRDRSGRNISLATGGRHVSLFASHSRVQGLNSYSIGTGLRYGALSAQLSASQFEDTDPLVLLSINYRYATNHSASIGLAERQDPKRSNRFYAVNGQFFDGGLNYRARFNNDIDPERRQFEAGLSHRNRYFGSTYSLRTSTERREQVFNLSSGIAYAGGSAVYFGNNLSQGSGVVLVNSDTSGAQLSLNGIDGRTNRFGQVLLPASAFRDQTIYLDPNSLDETSLPDKTFAEFRVYPGQRASVEFVANTPAGFIMIDGANINDLVSVNDVEGVYYEFGIYTEALKIGVNRIEVNGRIYRLNVKSLEVVLPTFNLTDKDRIK